MAGCEHCIEHRRPGSTVGVVGAGRVGAVLGAALARAGHHVVARLRRQRGQPGPRRRPAARRAACRTVAEVVAGAELVLLAVPDDALAHLVAGLAATGAWQAGQLVVHTCGRHGVAVLEPARAAARAAAGAAPGDDLHRHRDGPRPAGRLLLRGDRADEPLRPLAEALVIEMGGDPVWVAEEDRRAYHAALAHGANHLVTLVAQSMELLASAGVDEPRRVLGPLLRAALDNALRAG